VEVEDEDEEAATMKKAKRDHVADMEFSRGKIWTRKQTAACNSLNQLNDARRKAKAVA
jgi:hypothetical protein